MKRRDFEDDGRTIADMSGIEAPSIFPVRRPRKKRDPAGDAPDAPERREEPLLTKKQNRSYMWGAVLAGLLIAGVFIACGAVAIFLMTLVWH